MLLILPAVFCLAIYDFTGNYKVNIDVSDINNNTVSVDTFRYANNVAWAEYVWNTGDTGKTIIIDTPGLYIVSVKDVWTIKRGNGDGFTFDTIYQDKCLFLKGYPDGVRIDTIVMDTVMAGINYQEFRTINIIINGKVTAVTYRDTAWTDGTKTYYTETHEAYYGFWSGRLDSIVIQEQRLPIRVNAKVLINEGNAITGKKWRTIY